MPEKKLILPDGTTVPNHLAIVLDGNGRWARSKGLPATKGHEAGAAALHDIISASRDFGIHTLTLWGFSTENWKRPPQEVAKIHRLIKENIKLQLKKAKEEDVRFHHIGRKDRLPLDLMRWINKAERETRHNSKYILNLAIDYGGRDELIRAFRKIVEKGTPVEQITEELIDSYLDTTDQPYPYPDLFIRTSGEQRTSGLMPWQMTYAELYFEPDHLPDFTPEKLRSAILDYSRRRRRYGAKDKVKHFRFNPQMIAGLEINWWRLENIPEGTKFREYAIQHLIEQFGMSKGLAKEAAKHMISAILLGKKNQWEKSLEAMKLFYELIKDEIKLAFEPSVAASLQVKFWKDMDTKEDTKAVGDVEDTAKQLYAEVYRISAFQAAKIAHLRVLAQVEKNLAERGMGDHHWDNAEDYLEKFYAALKERVA